MTDAIHQADKGNGDDSNDAWLELLLHTEGEPVEVPDHGFTAALLSRLPAPATLTAASTATADRAMRLPLWFKALNVGALTIACAVLAWLLNWVWPDLLSMLAAGAGATALTTLVEGVFALLLLGGWLCWWSRLTLGELLWPNLA